MPYQIVYASSAAREMDRDDLADLLDHAREKNERLDVTGMLLYQDGAFLQVLEGEKETLETLYATIREDDRHTSITTLRAAEAEQREFGDWQMGFRNLSAGRRQELAALEGAPGFFNLESTEDKLKTLAEHPGMAYQALVRFKGSAPQAETP